MQRGDIWWANLGKPQGSAPVKRRPVLVVQADSFNESRIGTVMVAAITSNTRLGAAPGNVVVSKRISKLKTDSVVNISQVVTIDKSALTDRVSSLNAKVMREVDDGLRLSLSL